MNFRLSISPQHGDRDIRKMSKISFGGSVEVGDPVSLANNGTIKFVDHHKSTKHQRERERAIIEIRVEYLQGRDLALPGINVYRSADGDEALSFHLCKVIRLYPSNDDNPLGKKQNSFNLDSDERWNRKKVPSYYRKRIFHSIL